MNYWQDTTDYEESRRNSHEANLEILKRFREAGIDIAFPTMTVNIEDGSNPMTATRDRDDPVPSGSST